MTTSARRAPTEVRLDRLTKRFGETWAVRDVSLRVAPGEVFTFLGPSGCGKTTLLRLVAGFTEPDAGEIYLGGAPASRLPPWKRDVGMVFQSYALWPHLTVFENVAFGLRERRASGADLRERVRRVLALTGLEGLEGRRPSALSGGQQQRVALARTLVVEPRVLLLDEPLSNLDAKLRAQMREEIATLQRRVGLTTIYVTHDQEEALALSTRIAVFSAGRLVQVGTPKEIYDAPASRFVAEFVGASNLLAGEVVAFEGEQARLETPAGVTFQVPRATLPSGARAGQRLLACVRPEALRLTPAAAGAAGQVGGTVGRVTYLGSHVRYLVRVDGAPDLVAVEPGARGRAPFAEGERVSLAFDPSAVSLIPEGGEEIA
jgi:iron(III) transport system ATP-binding protein